MDITIRSWQLRTPRPSGTTPGWMLLYLGSYSLIAKTKSLYMYMHVSPPPPPPPPPRKSPHKALKKSIYSRGCTVIHQMNKLCCYMLC